jgi:hypothetical protein
MATRLVRMLIHSSGLLGNQQCWAAAQFGRLEPPVQISDNQTRTGSPIQSQNQIFLRAKTRIKSPVLFICGTQSRTKVFEIKCFWAKIEMGLTGS